MNKELTCLCILLLSCLVISSPLRGNFHGWEDVDDEAMRSRSDDWGFSFAFIIIAITSRRINAIAVICCLGPRSKVIKNRITEQQEEEEEEEEDSGCTGVFSSYSGGADILDEWALGPDAEATAAVASCPIVLPSTPGNTRLLAPRFVSNDGLLVGPVVHSSSSPLEASSLSRLVMAAATLPAKPLNLAKAIYFTTNKQVEHN